MFNILYTRTEFHGEPEECQVPLSVFLYDIPYLAPFYIFPPLHILNENLKKGSSGGGMSPGCMWEPFELEDNEYQQLLPLVLKPDLIQLQKKARYAMFAYQLEDSFDHIEGRFEWLAAISQKYREAFFIRQQRYLDSLTNLS